MTAAAITQALNEGEKTLWSGRPHTPDSLLAYRGWHRVVGIAFIAMAAVMAATSWSNRAEIDVGSAVGVLILITTPLIFGFGIWFGLSWLQHDARQRTHYAVTNKRVLVVNKHGEHGHTLSADATIAHRIGKAGIDKIQFDQANIEDKQRVTPQAKAFLLHHDDAVAAYQALKTLRGSQ